MAPNMHIDYAVLQDVGLAPWLFNLYIDPKEAMPVGHRRNAWLATVIGSLKAHAATFKKYPPKDIGL
jgi:arylsulfatase